jgi:hypothetical protein
MDPAIVHLATKRRVRPLTGIFHRHDIDMPHQHQARSAARPGNARHHVAAAGGRLHHLRRDSFGLIAGFEQFGRGRFVAGRHVAGIDRRHLHQRLGEGDDLVASGVNGGKGFGKRWHQRHSPQRRSLKRPAYTRVQVHAINRPAVDDRLLGHITERGYPECGSRSDTSP